jgi:hypothetical protein
MECVDNVGDLKKEKELDCSNYTSDDEDAISYDDGFEAGKAETEATIRCNINKMFEGK